MAKCWTCGSNMGGPTFSCPSCNGLKQLKILNEEARNVSKNIKDLSEIQYQGFKELKDVFADKLSEISSAIEWGFNQVSWHLEQQTEVLRSIDHTLKTPTQTQANEWRIMADELSRRGVLDEAEKHYIKSIESNLLDYRTYLGLAHLYIETNEFEKAKNILEKSLPHAPKKDIDYKSYSYRLIGHIYECWEDYKSASSILSNAIELSPNYADGHYDYSRYCAQLGNIKECIPSLEHAIHGNALYWDLAKNERTFIPVIHEVGKILLHFRTSAINKINNSIMITDNILLQVKKAIEEASIALMNSGDRADLNSPSTYQEIHNNLLNAKNKINKLNYLELLKLDIDINKYSKSATDLVVQANRERDYYLRRTGDKIRNREKRIGIAIKGVILGAIIGGIPGCVVGCLVELGGIKGAEVSGWMIGALIGIVIGLLNAKENMPRKIE